MSDKGNKGADRNEGGGTPHLYSVKDKHKQLSVTTGTELNANCLSGNETPSQLDVGSDGGSRASDIQPSGEETMDVDDEMYRNLESFSGSKEKVAVTKELNYGGNKVEGEVQGVQGSSVIEGKSSSTITKAIEPTPPPSNNGKEEDTAEILRQHVVITAAFDKCLSDGIKNKALFFKRIDGDATRQHMLKQKSSRHSTVFDNWKWNNLYYVKLPLSPQYNSWEKLCLILSELKSDCQRIVRDELDPKSIGKVLGRAVSRYQKYSSLPQLPFDVISGEEISFRVVQTIPTIIDFALELPTLLAEPIPILRRRINKTIFVSKRLCCSLLAHAFLCTLPEPLFSMPNINFARLLNLSNEPKLDVMMEKVMCILNYFHQIKKALSKEKNEGVARLENCIISFERRFTDQKVCWLLSNKCLVPVGVDENGRIEEKVDSLQVDFANRIVGGGVIGGGAVMEEILFSISPELILSRLFTEALQDDEVLIIKGAQQFSKYEGYASSFKFCGQFDSFQLERDALNRMGTEVVAMDALHFKRGEEDQQFKQNNFERELHKCFVGFLLTPTEINKQVATGNWGCGAFNGDAELKFLIQWMGASQTGRKGMIYHTCGDSKMTEITKRMVHFMRKNQVTVGQLYKIITAFYGEHFHNPSIFKFVEEQVTKINQKQPKREETKL